MKIVSKNNGRTIATGTFELSKMSNMYLMDRDNDKTWFFFQYLGDNLVLKNLDNTSDLTVCVEIPANDNLISLEVEITPPESDTTDEGILAEMQLTTEEKERLFVCIVNYALEFTIF